MIIRRQILVAAALITLSTPLAAQICDVRAGAPMQMQVQLTFGDQAPDSAPGSVSTQNDSIHRGDAAGVQRSHDFATHMQIHVQLQDPTAGTLQESVPGSDGQVRMTVCSKSIYRVRVTGPDIEEAILEDIHPGRGDKMVAIVLHGKMSKEQRKAQTAMISAQRLHVPKKAQKEMNKGDVALRKARLDEARKHYAKAVEIYPQFEEAENNLGIALMQLRNKEEAKAAFERAVALNNRFAPAQINLAKMAFDERRFRDALALAKQALSVEPLNPGGLFVAAEAAFFSAEYAETVSYTRTLHSLAHAQYGLVHFLAAKSLEAEHDSAAALAEYRTFLEEDPTDPNAKRARELMGLLQASQVTESQNSSPR